MTKCITLNGDLINVGPWQSKAVEVFGTEQEKQDMPPGALVVDGFWILNPPPEGAIEEDLDLAWTADGRIVKSGDPAAVRPLEEQAQ